jgi:polyribonucleotide nucleotidyltransferase
MKRLYTDYKAINKRQFFTQWLKEVKVTAHTHDSVNPLNPAYVPATADEKAVFEADNAFMFNVATKTVKYPSGKTIIQKHLDDMDGQTTFAELTADAKGEVVA